MALGSPSSSSSQPRNSPPASRVQTTHGQRTIQCLLQFPCSQQAPTTLSPPTALNLPNHLSKVLPSAHFKNKPLQMLSMLGQTQFQNSPPHNNPSRHHLRLHSSNNVRRNPKTLIRLASMPFLPPAKVRTHSATSATCVSRLSTRPQVPSSIRRAQAVWGDLRPQRPAITHFTTSRVQRNSSIPPKPARRPALVARTIHSLLDRRNSRHSNRAMGSRAGVLSTCESVAG